VLIIETGSSSGAIAANVTWQTAGLILTLGLYVLYYGAILWMSDGIPYVMDGNETFSSLWHARNLVDHGFALTAGLADEVFSTHAAAHPFVHTHQGNFPRVFATAIYFLGARSPESQIAVTTFLVGGASVAMMYRLLSKVVAAAFAVLACLLLLTDYVLYAQWQVVTYRVWHGFFFFSSLLLAQNAGGRRAGSVAFLTLLNAFCLFYWEIVFAAFAATTAGLYAGWTHRSSFRAVLWAWLPQIIGAVLAIALLVWQLSLYMGWDAAMEDLRATFMARNHRGSAEQILPTLQQFYNSRRVIFWPNFEDAGVYLDLAHFVASIGYYELQIWTPFLSLASIVLLLGGLSAVRWAGRIQTRSADRPLDSVTIRVLVSYPCLIAALVFVVHLGHRSLRGEIGILAVKGMAAVAVAIAVLSLVVTALELRRGSRAPLEKILRSGPPLFATLILAAILPSVIDHVSVEPAVADHYSILFSIFLTLYGATLIAFVLLSLQSFVQQRHDLDQSRSPRWMRSEGTSADIAFPIVAGVLTWVCLVALSDGFVPLGIQTASFAGISDLHWLPAVAAGVAGLVVLRIGPRMAPAAWQFRAASTTTIARYASWMAAALVVLLGGGFLFNQHHRETWLALHEATLDTGAARLALAGVLGLGAWLAVSRRGRAVSPVALARLSAVWPIVFAALGAYVVVYRLSPGYIFSGYRFRLAPFTVYATCLVLAAAWYPVWLAIVHGIGKFTRARRLARRRSVGPVVAGPVRRTPWWRMGGPALACAVGLCFAGDWIAIQSAYVRLLPPDYFGPLFAKLQRPPYVGRSMVLDGYPGAPAWFTGEWAYMDFKLPLAERDADGRLRRDDGMMWFADRETNPAYRRPDYYLCMHIQSLTTVSIEIAERRLGTAGIGGCEHRAIVELARSATPAGQDPGLELAEFDTEGLTTFGYARWAIVRLHWRDAR
jgi:hypothetical protein